MKGGTPEGAKSAVETKREKYGKNIFRKYGTKGGEARNKSKKRHLTFKDSTAASEAGRKGAEARWAKVRAEKAAKEAQND